jgi:hypothetical protein
MHLFRAYLGHPRITASLYDEHFIQLFWHYSNTIRGIRAAVDDPDTENATEAHVIYMNTLRKDPYPLNPVRAWPVVRLIPLLS